MKILYLLPHCSTGGMPQYVLKQIQSIKNQHDVHVIEINYLGDLYVVQRKQIEKIVKFQSVFGDQSKLPDMVTAIKPDVIHYQEVPNTFLDNNCINFLYQKDRKWFNVVTTHSSLTKGAYFSHYPDRIVAVNNWQKEYFQKELPLVDIEVWEYPIENKRAERLDYSHTGSQGMTEARRILNFKECNHREENCPHILNVGLFTPGKNQGELFEIARQNPNSTYHFVGNQAENFRSYWEPLMRKKPANCIIWGERDDLDLFYKACDEMYFTSKFELNPLCVKEALSYGLPVKMYKLPTYGNDYDNNPLVTYLN